MWRERGPSVYGAGGNKQAAPPATHTPVESPDTLRSKSYARAIFALSEGPILGVVNGQRSVFFDKTRLMNDDGSLNFKDVTYDTRNGYPDQAHIPGFPAAETEVSVGAEVTFSTSLVRTVSDTTATAVRVTITIPALVVIDPEKGDQYPGAVNIDISVQATGAPGYTVMKTDTIAGKCVSPYQRAYRIPLTGTGPWNVRVRRLSDDAPNSNTRNETHWFSYTVIRDYRISYRDTAVMAIQINAETFGGSVPQVEVDLDGVLVQVPNNYNPTTRVYTGIWDGTFQTAWTDNPAWLFYALLTNDRWGLGQFVDADAVDKWALYSIAQWCDQGVPDGRGGSEPRLTFNGVIDTAEDAYRVLVLIAGAFRSMVYWGSGAVTCVADRPVDPVKLIVPANVKEGKISYSGSSLQSRPTAVYCKFRDKNDNYEQATEPYEEATLISDRGMRRSEPVAMGCTSRGQALRAARWELETAWRETQTASWTAGFDQADLAPGDIVEIADPAIQGIQRGGRLLEISGTAVTLDRAVSLDPIVSYTLKVIDQAGAVQVRSLIVSISETTDEVTLASAFSPEPIVGAIWLLEASNLAPRRFRVIKVEEIEGVNEWRITALLHDPNKQSAIEYDLVVEDPPFTAIPTGAIPPPTALSVSETVQVLASGTSRHLVLLSWTPPNDPRTLEYNVQYKATTDTIWTDAGRSVGVTAELTELGSGTFDFRVQTIAFDFSPSPWAELNAQALSGLDAPPDDVENFRILTLSDTATLTWDAVTTPNLSHYEIRYSPDSGATTWEAAALLLAGVSGVSVQVPSRAGVYLIKAVTLQGVYSTNPAIVTSDIAGVLGINVVEVVEGAPDWIGTKTNVIVDTARQALILAYASDWFDRTDYFDWTDWFGPDGVVDEGTFVFDETVDLGAVFVSRITASVTAYGESITGNVFDHPDAFAVDNIFGAEPAGWSVLLEMRTTNDDPGGSPVWSDWAELVVSDVSARAFQFRVTLRTTDPFVTPVVEQVSITVDMPDRIIAGDDIIVPAAGVRITFSPAFKVSPEGIGIAIQDGLSGERYEITNKDATGFDIRFFTSGGSGVERVMDYVAKGYGAVQ